MEKDKKKTLTISTNLKKKIDTSSITTSGKKSFAVEKKKPFRSNKSFSKSSAAPHVVNNPENKKKNFARKFVEQQATKDFIKKDNIRSNKLYTRGSGSKGKDITRLLKHLVDEDIIVNLHKNFNFICSLEQQH